MVCYNTAMKLKKRMFTGRIGRLGFLFGFIYYILLLSIVGGVFAFILGVVDSFIIDMSDTVFLSLILFIGMMAFILSLYCFYSLFVRRAHDLNWPDSQAKRMFLSFGAIGGGYTQLLFTHGSYSDNNYGPPNNSIGFLNITGLL